MQRLVSIIREMRVLSLQKGERKVFVTLFRESVHVFRKKGTMLIVDHGLFFGRGAPKIIYILGYHLHKFFPVGKWKSNSRVVED